MATKTPGRAIGFGGLPLTPAQNERCESLFISHMVTEQFDHLGKNPVMFLFVVGRGGKVWAGSYAVTDDRLNGLQDWFYTKCRGAGARIGKNEMWMLSIYTRAGWRQHGYRSHQFIAVVVDDTVHARWMPSKKTAAGP